MFDLKLGDCMNIMRTIPDVSVDAVITDPPYGVSYQSAWRTDKKKRHPKVTNDGQPFVWWLPEAFRVLKEHGALLCFCRWDVQEAFRLAIGWAGFKVKQHLIWDRGWHGMGDIQESFAPQHDIIWQASKGSCKLRGVRPRSVIRETRIDGEGLVHPNQKPVYLMTQLIAAVTDIGDVVFDPFMGSGSTGVACVEKSRSFIGIEIESNYYKIAEKRIHSARKPLLPLGDAKPLVTARASLGLTGD